ncbi:hypothetical protein ACRQ5Q_14565 [Bradyrhizobium sp. PMVTL-01]|uniref:hypothetical protein n=1 Tax=Bradyrhizobium sp. PMVTL-01 TaxID=3434999 RepID=UPI003F6E4DA1
MRSITRLALDWALRSFGHEHVYNLSIRALRCAEEAIELAQAYDVPKSTVLQLVDVVYSRPPGNVDQELGGVAMTATILAAARHQDLDSYLETELRRVLAKPVEHFKQRNQDKVDLGLTV